eukprot:gene28701-35603_t
MEDKKGLNILHYLVERKSEPLMSFFVTSETRFTEEITKGCMRIADGVSYIFEWKDWKGRTAKDYATRHNQDGMVSMLDALEMQVYMYSQLTYDHMRSNSDQAARIDAFTAHFVNRPDLMHYSRLTLNNYRLMRIRAFEFARSGTVAPALKSFVGTWKLDLSSVNVLDTDTHAQNESSIILQCLKGPMTQYFSLSDLSGGKRDTPVADLSITVDELNVILKSQFYFILMKWDGAVESMCDYLISKRDDRLDHCYSISNFSHHYYSDFHLLDNKLPPSMTQSAQYFGCAFIEQLINRYQDTLIADRIACMSWLIRDLHIPLPRLHLFVKWGQFRLLRWACDEGLADLSAPLSASPDLLEFAQTMDWLSPTDCDRVTVAEFLCALAASLDELQIFQWLFAEKIADREFRVGGEGLNMLHLAATCNSYMVATWLVANNHCHPLLQSGAGLNAAHIVASKKHKYLFDYLIERTSPQVLDVNGCDVLYHALNPPCKCGHFCAVCAWTSETITRNAYATFVVKFRAERVVFSEWLIELNKYHLFDSLVERFPSIIEPFVMSAERQDLWEIEQTRETDPTRTLVLVPEIEGTPRTSEQEAMYLRVNQYVKCIVLPEEEYYNFTSEELTRYIFILAVEQNQIEFFVHVKQCVMLTKDSYSPRDYLSYTIETAVTCANKFQRPEISSFLSAWIKELQPNENDIDKYKDTREARAAVLAHFVGGSSVEVIERAMDVFSALEDVYFAENGKHYYSIRLSSFHFSVDNPKEDNYARKSERVLHVMLSEGHWHIVDWLLAKQCYGVKYVCDALMYVVDKHVGLDAVRRLVDHLDTCTLHEPSDLSVTLHDKTDHVLTLEEFKLMHIREAIIKAAGGEHRVRKVVDIKTQFDVFCYLVDYALSKGADLRSFVRKHSESTECHASILRHVVEVVCIGDHPDSWSMLHYLLARRTMSDLNATSPHPRDYRGKQPLIVSMVDNQYRTCESHIRKAMCKDNEAELALLSDIPQCVSLVEREVAHFISVIELLHARGLKIYEFETEILGKLSNHMVGSMEGYASCLLVKYFSDRFGFRLQSFSMDRANHEEGDKFPTEVFLKDLMDKQTKCWKLADAIEKGMTSVNLLRIAKLNSTSHFTTSKYHKGRSLLHIAALHNRVDVMQWLVRDHGMDIHAVDSLGDSVLALSVKSGSTEAAVYIRKVVACRLIASFVFRNFHRRRSLKH